MTVFRYLLGLQANKYGCKQLSFFNQQRFALTKEARYCVCKTSEAGFFKLPAQLVSVELKNTERSKGIYAFNL